MKKTLVLLGLLVALIVAIYGVPQLLSLRKSPELFNGFNPGQVTEISLSKFGSHETLKNVNGQWMATAFGDYPADTVKVKAALDIVSKQKKGTPRSKNPAKHKELGVDTASAIKITLKGAKEFSFYIGNMAQGWSGNFLRFNGQNEVYVTDGSFETAFSITSNFFRDKTLLRLNKDNVKAFSVAAKDDSTKQVTEFAAQFDAASGKWKIEKPESAEGDASRLNDYLGQFTALQVDDWYEQEMDAQPAFNNPTLKAVFQMNDGTSLTLLLGAEKNGNLYASVLNDPNKYLLRKYRLNNLKKKWTDLKAAPAAAASAAPENTPMTMPGMQ
ncbi:MAG: hypothetical protein A2293_05435 [Elusimicrobia bacterium RIFOXYB2_FULL_49_7]|nr:MAG: hypothetical protein A2293_05435 [Elusimicrobia bacterium RIFOXYB2_FULL_49_7]